MKHICYIFGFITLLPNISYASEIHEKRKETYSIRTTPTSTKKKTTEWYEAPIIVGGTGGSGTRGVEDVLVKLGVYMYPKDPHSPLLALCFNGDAHDNQCMNPEGRIDLKKQHEQPSSASHESSSNGGSNSNGHVIHNKAHSYNQNLKRQVVMEKESDESSSSEIQEHGGGSDSLLMAWLLNKQNPSSSTATRIMNLTHNKSQMCQSQAFKSLGISKGGRAYLDSIPVVNRQPLRWGWKHPRSMYYLNKVYKLYPNMLFIQVLRQPLDMSASYLEHLSHRIDEFRSINGGTFQKASHFYEQTCQSLNTFKNNKYIALKENMCKFPWKDFEILKSQQRLAKKGEEAFKSLNLEVKPLALRCMDMMLWGQINAAVDTFGERCLQTSRIRYFRWHTEDSLGLRGVKNRTILVSHIAKALGVNHQSVDEAMRKSAVPMTFISSATSPKRRRLSYGKYKEVLKRDTIPVLQSCAEATAPGSLDRFKYH